LLRNGSFREIVEICEAVPLTNLLSSIPLFASINDPHLNDFLDRAVDQSPVFAHRLWLFCHQRPSFAHLQPVCAKMPAPAFVTFIDSVASTLQKGQVLPIDAHHPFTFEPIAEVRVDHVFSSLARPAIISFVPAASGSSPPSVAAAPAESYCRLLVKRNEDIYHESAIQLLFKCMNELWADFLPWSIRPFVCSFREVPAHPKLGFLQIVEGCRDLEEIERANFEAIAPENVENFLRTTCGWALAAYLLGLSDRHRENTLVRLADASAIPIDFGFMLGNTAPSINTYMITISPQFYQFLLAKQAWSSFATMFIAGFAVVRHHADIFLALAAQLFTGHRDPAFVRKFIANRLLLQETEATVALDRLVKRLRHAPICSDTKSKIENHQKNKQFLAKHGQNFMVRLVIKRAVEAAPQVKTEGRFHHASVKLQLPNVSDLPIDTPQHILAYFAYCENQKVQRLSGKLPTSRDSNGSNTLQSPSNNGCRNCGQRMCSCWRSEKGLPQVPIDTEAMPQFLASSDEILPDQQSSVGNSSSTGETSRLTDALPTTLTIDSSTSHPGALPPASRKLYFRSLTNIAAAVLALPANLALRLSNKSRREEEDQIGSSISSDLSSSVDAFATPREEAIVASPHLSPSSLRSASTPSTIAITASPSPNATPSNSTPNVIPSSSTPNVTPSSSTPNVIPSSSTPNVIPSSSSPAVTPSD
jgi:hypothetical protein